jgi:hypothetical protein
MSEAVKVTVNLPKKPLAAAMRITGKGLTRLVEGLMEIEKRAKRSTSRGRFVSIWFSKVLAVDLVDTFPDR